MRDWPGGRAGRSLEEWTDEREHPRSKRDVLARELPFADPLCCLIEVRLLREDRLTRSVLDLALPRRAHLILQLGGKRHIIELDSHLVAVLERPVEELQGLGYLLRLLRILRNEDEGRSRDRPSL